MTPGKVEIELKSNIDSLPVISDFINDTLTGFQADTATINKVQLAVDEACTNIIHYAYLDLTGTIKIILESTGDEILITIIDKGKPFDPTSVPPPDIDSDVEQRKIGGLGIYLIQKLMDNVSYSYDSQEGNKLTLRKRLSPGPANK